MLQLSTDIAKKIAQYDQLNSLYWQKTHGESEDFKDYLAMYIHHSTAIEGNTFSFRDTKTFLETGVTIPNKQIDEHNEILDLRDAYMLMLDYIKTNEPIYSNGLFQLHYELLKRTKPEHAGKFKIYPNRNSLFLYPPPEQSKMLWSMFMTNLKEDYAQEHVLVQACLVHFDIVSIHPFQDGNGRTARLAFEWILKKNNAYSQCFHKDNKMPYIDSLEKSYTNEGFELFLNFCLDSLNQNLQKELSLLKEHELKNNQPINKDNDKKGFLPRDFFTYL